MDSNVQNLLAIVGVIAILILIPLAVIFVGVPVLKGIGGAVGATFRGAGWLIRHVVEFVFGTLGDAVRLVGAIIAGIVLMPLMVFGVVFGRWSKASHFAGGVAREARVFGGCLYRILIRRPLKFVLLHGLLEGIEQRVPEAMMAAPGPDQPNRRTGQFDGYRIVGSLRPGGSGAKLYVAEPNDTVRAKNPRMPELVVIKSFAITDGSSLPQIVRESRALECARQMGLIFDHGLDEQRFFYVMPYHAGENLGVIARQLHGESAGNGLEDRGLRAGVGYVADLVSTLASYHRGGLWHKDVKPDNIIVHNGVAHLVDLGLVTPLRSAMTLTTHGTEYFRDPEMVRQALRGVKVHEVDGVKFDVYAAGAVLYFVLENTFPAHGALSAFSKRSPESLRWIVRRAMAEYTKRYEQADVMLADLRHVLGSSDPFTVRPADLPSMRAEQVVVAGAPAGGGFVPAAAIGAAAVAAGSAGSPRPRIRVTNWWTGAYVMEDGDAAGRPSASPVVDFSGWRGAAAKAASTARPKAEAQIASARRRAADLRTKARARVDRHMARRPHQPSKGLIVLSSLVIVGIVAVVVASTGRASHRTRTVSTAQARMSIPALPTLPFADHDAVASAVSDAASVVDDAIRKVEREIDAKRRSIASGDGASTDLGAGAAAGHEPLRALLVNTHTDPANPRVTKTIEREIAERQRRGWLVCGDDVESIALISPLISAWNGDRVRFDGLLEDALEHAGYAAIVWIHATPGKGLAVDRTAMLFVTAERPGWQDRRGACGGTIAMDDAATPDVDPAEGAVDGAAGEPEARATTSARESPLTASVVR